MPQKMKIITLHFFLLITVTQLFSSNKSLSLRLESDEDSIVVRSLLIEVTDKNNDKLSFKIKSDGAIHSCGFLVEDLHLDSSNFDISSNDIGTFFDWGIKGIRSPSDNFSIEILEKKNRKFVFNFNIKHLSYLNIDVFEEVAKQKKTVLTYTKSISSD